MPYTAPTAADIKTRFPAFAGIDNALIELYIDEAMLWVDTTWFETDYTIAIQYLTAHFMAAEGLLVSATGSGSAAGAVSGPIKSERLGDAAITYSDRGSTGGWSGTDADLATTPYGQRFLALRNANHPAILTTGVTY